MALSENLDKESVVEAVSVNPSKEAIENCGRQIGNIRVNLDDALGLELIREEADRAVTEERDWQNTMDAFL